VSYLEHRSAELKAAGVRVRRIGFSASGNPVAVTAEHLLIGGDCPVAFDFSASLLGRRATIRNARIANGIGPAAEAAWEKIQTAEIRW